MKCYELDDLKDGYEIINPIIVRERRFKDVNGSFVYMTVVGLENEMIFGMARHFQDAKEMLIDTIISYYHCLLQSNEKGEDKEYLMRSIRESNT